MAQNMLWLFSSSCADEIIVSLMVPCSSVVVVVTAVVHVTTASLM